MNYFSWLGCTLSAIALVGLGIAGPGHRLRWWNFKSGIGLVKLAAYFSMASIGACLTGIALWLTETLPGGLVPGLLGLGVGGMVLAWTLGWKLKLNSLPYIHDITTDTDDPPEFVAILPHRAGAPNPADYGGPDLARQQHRAYPDLRPGNLSGATDSAFALALQAAKDMGWKIVAAEPRSLRIEATDTTFWFGFKDDVVVRLTPTPSGNKIDVRSTSRVGTSDVGVNARRIKAYLARVI